MADMSSEMPSGPTVPIHNAPKAPVRRRAKPVEDTLVDHTAKPVSTIAGEPPTEPSKRRGHALDFAPVHSKIVVTTEGAVFATPNGVSFLPKTDSAAKLPVGARIEKIAADQYRSQQLNATLARPATVHATAIEAIAAFVEHFHLNG